MSNTKEFMMIFSFTPDFSNQPSQEELDQMQQSWGKFIGNLAVSEKLVSTHQLSFNGVQIAADHSTTDGINVADGKTMGGNMIVKAATMDEAVELAKQSPILYAPGGNVEVREITPMG